MKITIKVECECGRKFEFDSDDIRTIGIYNKGEFKVEADYEYVEISCDNCNISKVI
jgi:hypothetical protein